VKLRADHEAVRRRLDDRGAGRRGAVEQVDTYYDAPNRDFAETDEALRVRREMPLDPAGEAGGATRTRLTYKGPLVDDASKTRSEHGTGVEDGAALAGILRGLGYDPAAVVEKERETHVLGAFTVTLDTVAGLGEFVEVEGIADGDEVASVREDVFEACRELGLDPGEATRESYLELLLAAGRATPVDRDDPDPRGE